MQLRHFPLYIIITRFVCPVWIASFSPNRDTEHFHWQCTYCHLFTPTHSEYHSILMSTVGIHSHVLDYSNSICFWHSLSSLPLACLHGLTCFLLSPSKTLASTNRFMTHTHYHVCNICIRTYPKYWVSRQLHILITIFLHVSIILSL